MVCVYCSGSTVVANSRHQKQGNRTWRRRRCLDCGATVTTIEKAAYEQCLSVQKDMSHIVPLQRDLLFLSVYDACRHRQDPASDAAALTDTILDKLIAASLTTALVRRNDIILAASEVLSHFDDVARTHYQAFHRLS